MKAEEWRPVVGYEGLYEVSDQGNVRSLDRFVEVRGERVRFRKGRDLKKSKDSGGRLTVCLHKPPGIKQTGHVHRLVARAFLGEPPGNRIVLHGPGGRLDNRVCNLSYGTYLQNNGADRVRDGTDHRGHKHNMAKLSHDAMLEIRRKHNEGALQVELAKEYGISQPQVSRICLGQAWSHDEAAVAERRYIRNGKAKKGTAHHMTSISEDDVREMRKLRAEGAVLRVLAKKYGVTMASASNICNHKTWKHVT